MRILDPAKRIWIKFLRSQPRRLLGANYGPGAVEAVKAAAASHPLVAKILMHGLANVGTLSVAKYLRMFGGK